MSKLAAVLAATIITAGSTYAMAQAGGAGGAGSDLSTPRKNTTRPTANSPTVNRRNDDMPAGMNALPGQTMTKKGDKRS